jgi:hypothetical protein
MVPSFRVLFLIFSLALVSGEASSKPNATPAGASSTQPVVVIGFVGGYVRHDAHEAVLRRLDANNDGKLSPEEKQNARIIIFGHSWGASETVELARQLEKDGIPVLLTIQVDSVSKRGENDAVIPANVSQAVNFYQLDGMLHGQSQIRAANPAHTRILGNFRSDYKAKPLTCGQYPWWDRLFMKPHIQIECDPAVWSQVESLIRSNLSLEAHLPQPSETNSPVSPLK